MNVGERYEHALQVACAVKSVNIKLVVVLLAEVQRCRGQRPGRMLWYCSSKQPALATMKCIIQKQSGTQCATIRGESIFQCDTRRNMVKKQLVCCWRKELTGESQAADMAMRFMQHATQKFGGPWVCS